MGKSSSKLLQQQGLSGSNGGGTTTGTNDDTNISAKAATTTTETNHANYLLNENDLRNWCKGFTKDFPNAQLTSIIDNEQLLAPFLTEIFYQEVEFSDCMQTLFRGNCLASKIMSHCFRTFGSKYLKQLLKPHIEPLLSDTIEYDDDKLSSSFSALNSPTRAIRLKSTNNQVIDKTANIENTSQSITKQSSRDSGESEDLNDRSQHQNESCTPVSSPISYEIDSSRLQSDDGDIDVNQKNLLRLTEQILDSILSSATEFPPQLNSMCICLRQVLSKKYSNPNINLKAVGTVIFLRFINPAIVSPVEAGIIDRQPSQRTMRGLKLVSKILQNIANNVEFSKEEHMLPFNDFVRAQFEPVRRWVLEISTERGQLEPFTEGGNSNNKF